MGEITIRQPHVKLLGECTKDKSYVSFPGRQDVRIRTLTPAEAKCTLPVSPRFEFKKFLNWGNPTRIQSQSENILYVHSSAR